MVHKINQENIDKFLKINVRDINLLKERMEEISSIKLLGNKINKLDFTVSPFLKAINNILDSSLDSRDKQALIEKAIANYDVNLFKSNINNPLCLDGSFFFWGGGGSG